MQTGPWLSEPVGIDQRPLGSVEGVDRTALMNAHVGEPDVHDPASNGRCRGVCFESFLGPCQVAGTVTNAAHRQLDTTTRSPAPSPRRRRRLHRSWPGRTVAGSRPPMPPPRAPASRHRGRSPRRHRLPRRRGRGSPSARAPGRHGRTHPERAPAPNRRVAERRRHRAGCTPHARRPRSFRQQASSRRPVGRGWQCPTDRQGCGPASRVRHHGAPSPCGRCLHSSRVPPAPVRAGTRIARSAPPAGPRGRPTRDRRAR